MHNRYLAVINAKNRRSGPVFIFDFAKSHKEDVMFLVATVKTRPPPARTAWVVLLVALLLGVTMLAVPCVLVGGAMLLEVLFAQ